MPLRPGGLGRTAGLGRLSKTGLKAFLTTSFQSQHCAAWLWWPHTPRSTSRPAQADYLPKAMCWAQQASCALLGSTALLTWLTWLCAGGVFSPQGQIYRDSVTWKTKDKHNLETRKRLILLLVHSERPWTVNNNTNKYKTRASSSESISFTQCKRKKDHQCTSFLLSLTMWFMNVCSLGVLLLVHTKWKLFPPRPVREPRLWAGVVFFSAILFSGS